MVLVTVTLPSPRNLQRRWIFQNEGVPTGTPGHLCVAALLWSAFSLGVWKDIRLDEALAKRTEYICQSACRSTYYAVRYFYMSLHHLSKY